MAFVPDATREPSYVSGELDARIPFREAISALHDVVVSDLRFKPKDKTAYKEWAAKQELVDFGELARQRAGNAKQLEELQAELVELQRRAATRMSGFYRARQKYFDWLYAWFVLDPVITVHPDEVFFECFSQDESSYGRLGASYEVFRNIGSFACGTTNIDYSAALYDELQKIRSYKTTKFGVDPSGFEVKTTGEEDFKDAKGKSHDWRRELFDALKKRQNKDGSFVNKGDKAFGEADANLATAFALLSLSYTKAKK
jgi:hypothetical protein